MQPLSRLRHELQQLARPLGAAQMTRYAAALALALPGIIRQRSLAPADTRMTGDVRFAVNGVDIVVPLTRITEMLRGHDATPTFGGLREMYASNVYLRAFRREMPMRTVVDLGANRGLFSLLAVKAYGARIAVGVEPGSHFAPVAAALRAANDIAETAMPREQKFVASQARPDAITMEALMAKYALGDIDFVKCDIEGGEYDVLVRENRFLSSVSNLAMEMHPHAGPTDAICDALQDRGFVIRTTDQFGGPDKGRPHYLYASRTGHLA